VNGALGAAIPLQLLAERLARARGTNPDTLGREDPRQAAAADA
jgi:glucosamine 6-phosphate synthetase-like amidotransferase/phosphosugar isomerase protein